MLLKRVSGFILALPLVLAIMALDSVQVSANSEEPVAYKKKRCVDRPADRDAAEDEERSSGECSGTVPTPEPVSILLFTAGLAGVGFAARRRLRKTE